MTTLKALSDHLSMLIRSSDEYMERLSWQDAPVNSANERLHNYNLREWKRLVDEVIAQPPADVAAEALRAFVVELKGYCWQHGNGQQPCYCEKIDAALTREAK